MEKAKNCPRGFNGFAPRADFEYWCDKNAVVFFDNDVSSSKTYWSTKCMCSVAHLKSVEK